MIVGIAKPRKSIKSNGEATATSSLVALADIGTAIAGNAPRGDELRYRGLIGSDRPERDPKGLAWTVPLISQFILPSAFCSSSHTFPSYSSIFAGSAMASQQQAKNSITLIM
jgi:hypothetical protein